MAEKMWKVKIGTKNKENQQKTITDMVDISPNRSIIILNISGIKTIIKRQNSQSESKHKT